MPYSPRSYQRRFLNAFTPIVRDWRSAQVRRFILVWHRRAGKDMTAVNAADAAMKTRSGVYYHFLPSYAQAKKIIWDGRDKEGRKFVDNFDPAMIEATHDTELKITYKPSNLTPSGAIYQLIGGDQIDSIVGTNPVGCIFSEYPLMNPRAWDLVRPILRENGGWAIFDYTPRGKNHGFKLWEGTQGDPEWYHSLLTIEDTRRDADGEDNRPIMTPADVEGEIRAGMTRELAAQEFYCSWEGALEGAYYADQMNDAEKQGRITSVQWDRALPVDTSWDFGLDDVTSIWFTQTVSPREHRVIEYVEAPNVALSKWIEDVLWKRPYAYGEHFGPHDVKVREYTSGNARLQFAAEKGVHFTVQPKLPVEDGIDAGRRILPVSWFDEDACIQGINALRSYHREKDEKLGTFKATPKHDWASHGADAWRTRAVAWRGSSGRGSPVADFRYHLQRRHEEMQPEADMSWKRNEPAGAREARIEIDTGDDWWRN